MNSKFLLISFWKKFFLGATIVISSVGSVIVGPRFVSNAIQQPTGSVPTVTGTPEGAMVQVALTNNIEVYAGPIPGTFPIIGYLVPAQVVPAFGRTQDSEWIQIYYPGVTGNVGWVFALYVSLISGNLPPIVSTPSFPTPRLTPTLSIDLATALAKGAFETRLPTFTPPPQVVIPTFTSETGTTFGVPSGFIILALVVIGIFGAIISFTRGR